MSITSFIILITNSRFQTSLANKLAKEINNEFGTEIVINKATLSYTGKVDLRDFLIRDHKHDTLIFFKNLYLSPSSIGKLVSSDLNFNSISVDGLDLKISTYLNESQNSLEIFLKKLNKENDESIKKFKNTGFGTSILAKNSSFKIINYNNNSNDIRLSNIDFSLSDIELINQDFNFTIDDVNFDFENRLELSSLSGIVEKKDSIISFENSKIFFGNSNLNGNLKLDYSNIIGSNIYSLEFINSIYMNLEIKDSNISSKDIGNIFTNFKTTYDESWMINTTVEGYVNDLLVNNFSLNNNRNTIKLKSEIKNLFQDNYLYAINVLNFDIDSKEIIN